MEDEHKAWEEEQRRTHAGVKVEELNQVRYQILEILRNVWIYDYAVPLLKELFFRLLLL